MAGDPVDDILEQWRRERPDLDPSPIGIFGRIARIDRILDDVIAQLLRPAGLTLGLFDVLAALRRRGHPYRAKASELATTTMLTSGGMTGRLDQLEALGLVTRIDDPEDRRVVIAELTPQGLDLIDRLMAEHLEREARLLGDLEPGDRVTLSRLLGTLEGTMHEEPRRR